MEPSDIYKVYDNDSARRWTISTDVDLPPGTHFTNPVEVSTETGLVLGFVTIDANSPAAGKVPAQFFLRYDCPERLDAELGQVEWVFAYRVATLSAQTPVKVTGMGLIQPGEGILHSIALVTGQQARGAVSSTP